MNTFSKLVTTTHWIKKKLLLLLSFIQQSYFWNYNGWYGLWDNMDQIIIDCILRWYGLYFGMKLTIFHDATDQAENYFLLPFYYLFSLLSLYTSLNNNLWKCHYWVKCDPSIPPRQHTLLYDLSDWWQIVFVIHVNYCI